MRIAMGSYNCMHRKLSVEINIRVRAHEEFEDYLYRFQRCSEHSKTVESHQCDKHRCFRNKCMRSPVDFFPGL